MALNFNSSANAKRVTKIQDKTIQKTNTTATLNIPVDKIKVNPDNEWIYGEEESAVEELSRVIGEDGFTDPCGVYDSGDGTYELFSGHKRYRAMIRRGEPTVPCDVYAPPKDDIERARRLIRSNSKGKEYNPIQIAREIKYYYDHVIVPQNKPGTKRKQLAEEYGMSEGNIQKYLSLLDLIPELQKLCYDKTFPFSSLHSAKKLDEEKQKVLAETLKNKMSSEEDISREVILDEIRVLSGKESLLNKRLDEDSPVDEEKYVHGEHISHEETYSDSSETMNSPAENALSDGNEYVHREHIAREYEVTENNKEKGSTVPYNTTQNSSTETGSMNYSIPQDVPHTTVVPTPNAIPMSPVVHQMDEEMQRISKRIHEMLGYEVRDKETVLEYVKATKADLENLEKKLM